MRIKSIITATALLLMSSCKEQSRTLIFALDYSKSTGVDRISKMDEILSVAKQGDKVIVYPIHGRTASATPIAERIIPPCEDINCERQRSNILKDITSDIDKNFKKSNISPKVKSSTSITPIFSKLRILGDKQYQSLYIISDMIEENTRLDFVELFPALTNEEVVKLANLQLSEWKNEIDIQGSNVSILIPGTVSGSLHDDEFHRKVILFWDTFIKEAGGVMNVRYLS